MGTKTYDMKKWSFLILLAAVVWVACSKSADSSSSATTPNSPMPSPSPSDCSAVDSKFSTNVSAIIQSSCTGSGCHNAGSTNGPGALTNFAQISANATAIRQSVESGRMPRGITLSTAQRNAISCWVMAGAPNN
ncbi:MAG: hypothetical protein EAZ62_07290 [Sphingobacteriia bacterium]|nr:MAG: hypothetical protein EAZ62_07290 [Sphingobacteriia bacterium]